MVYLLLELVLQMDSHCLVAYRNLNIFKTCSGDKFTTRLIQYPKIRFSKKKKYTQKFQSSVRKIHLDLPTVKYLSYSAGREGWSNGLTILYCKKIVFGFTLCNNQLLIDEEKAKGFLGSAALSAGFLSYHFTAQD